MTKDAPKPGPIAGAPGGSSKTQLATAPGIEVRRIEKLRVTVLESPDEKARGTEHVFAQDEVRIGSNPGLELTLQDRLVSREHLSIRPAGRGWLIEDTQSTNGVSVGEMKVERATVLGPTRIKVGSTILKLEPLGEHVEQEISSQNSFGRMLGKSDAMREMFAVLERVAPSELTVLVEGETGTGKELAAEGIHEASGRQGPFVTLNCGAIPRELIESELMGHVKGAFTGAVSDRPGAFVAADGGTLLLDEIGELPIDMQAKLLRVLEAREVKPVGSDRSRKVDVRVVAATHRNLERDAKEGTFRQDLYYRLAVVVVRIPPLRTRLDDLPMLVSTIQGSLSRRRESMGQPPYEPLGEAALGMLGRYHFPGNVRELRNIVERWSVLGADTAPGGPAVRSGTTNPGTEGESTSSTANGQVESSLIKLPYHEAKEVWIERFERAYVVAALQRNDGKVSAAAREAKVDRRHFQRLIARYDIEKPS